MEYLRPAQSPPHDTPARGSVIERMLINLSGIPANVAYEHGSVHERSDLMVAGAVLVGSSSLTGVTATTGLYLGLGNGSLGPLYVLAGIGIGLLTGMIDLAVQFKGAIGIHGQKELRRAGLSLPAVGGTRYGLIRAGRVAQAATFGLLGGLFLTLAANQSDIRAYETARYLALNKTVAAEAARTVDNGIARSKKTLALQESELNSLSRSAQSLRANDVRRAIGRRNGATETANAQLDALEQRMSTEAAKRDALAADVTAREMGRGAAIEKIVDEWPNAVRKRTGLAAQIEALSNLTAENPKFLLLLLAFEFLSLCLELGPMWAAASKIPSSLAARIALDHFLVVSALAKDGAEKLGLLKDDGVEKPSAAPANDNLPPEVFASTPSNDNLQTHAAANGLVPVKRPRGRPRRNGIDSNAGENDHE